MAKALLLTAKSKNCMAQSDGAAEYTNCITAEE